MKLELFNSVQFGEIRGLEIDGKPYFVANDVLKVLGYAEGNWRTTLSRKCKGVAKCNVPHPQNSEKTLAINVIPQGDVVRLAATSKLPGAEQFESWIFDEVIPTIIKTGGYVQENRAIDFVNNWLPMLDDASKSVIATTLEHNQKLLTENKKLTVVVEEQEKTIDNKTAIIDTIIIDGSEFSVGNTGRILKSVGVDSGQKKIFEQLRDDMIFMTTGDRWNIPYDKYMRHFSVKLVDTGAGPKKKVCFTGTGLKWYLNRLAKQGKLTSSQREAAEKQFEKAKQSDNETSDLW